MPCGRPCPSGATNSSEKPLPARTLSSGLVFSFGSATPFGSALTRVSGTTFVAARAPLVSGSLISKQLLSAAEKSSTFNFARSAVAISHSLGLHRHISHRRDRVSGEKRRLPSLRGGLWSPSL